MMKLNNRRAYKKSKKKRSGIIASKIKSITNHVSNNVKCCHFWSPVNVLPLKRRGNGVSGCSQIPLTEYILWACRSENMFLIQNGEMPHSELLFHLCLELTKMKSPGRPLFAWKYPWVEAGFGHLWKQDVGYSICLFWGTRSATNWLQKPFIFDLFIADSSSQDLPCNTARNLDRSQTSCTTPRQQMLEQMKPSSEEWAARRRSE